MKIELTKNQVLYQWDSNRQVKIMLPEGVQADEAHFAHPRDKEALVVRIKNADGMLVADIPNILLQSEQDIRVWLVSGDRTILGYNLAVLPRIKPADYVYTETEILRYETLEKRIEELAALMAYIEVEGSIDLNELEFEYDAEGNVTLVIPGAVITEDGEGNVMLALSDVNISDDGAGNVQIAS